jgi:hypothetical protein
VFRRVGIEETAGIRASAPTRRDAAHLSSSSARRAPPCRPDLDPGSGPLLRLQGVARRVVVACRSRRSSSVQQRCLALVKTAVDAIRRQMDRLVMRRAEGGGSNGLPTSVITQGAGLPPDDRSCDRNEQHRAALGTRPGERRMPTWVVQSRSCLHPCTAGASVALAATGRPDHSPLRRTQTTP